MRLNSKYYIPPKRFKALMAALDAAILSRKKKEELSTIIVVDEFYQSAKDIVAIEAIYKPEQFKEGVLKGKPMRLRLKRETQRSLTYNEFGYTGMIDIRKMLQFLHYTSIGTLNQFRTSFVLSTPLIEIPITIAETREFGSFIEIGETAGAVEDINNLLGLLARVTGLMETDLITEPYSTLLERVRNRT